MSRLTLLMASVAGLAVSVFGGSAFGQTATLVPKDSAGREEDNAGHADQADPLFEQTSQADKLFENGQWEKAQAAYDAIFAKQGHPFLPVAVRAMERAVFCSLKLQNHEDALRRVMAFHQSLEWQGEEDGYYWPQGETVKLATWRAGISRLEFFRGLLEQIAKEAGTATKAEFQRDLSKARIALNFQLLKYLDPDSVPLQEYWGWSSRYSDMDWWWEGIPEAESDFGERPSWFWWYWEVGIPLAADGKPLFLKSPVDYRPEQPRSEKILFLLDEIERCDSSPAKSAAAKALLHRADIARRLYGPNADPAWRNAEMVYRWQERPDFTKEATSRDIKEFWELDDDEARVIVGRRLQIVKLPKSQSPLALWHSLEDRFRESELVAEAIYQRGLYYQNRRQFAKATDEYHRLLERFPKNSWAQAARTQIDQIQHADVVLGETGIYPSGTKPKLWFACRNTDTVEFTVRKLDETRYIRERLEKGQWWDLGYSEFGRWSDEEPLKKYVGPVVQKWSQRVAKSDQVASHSTIAPLTKAGGYLIEARIPGTKTVSMGLIVLSDAAIIRKPLADKILLWIVDARTGKPLKNQTVEIYRRSNQSAAIDKKLTSDDNGVIEVNPEMNADQMALLTTENGGVAFCELGSTAYQDFEGMQQAFFGVTDRPLYRPGSTVRFKIWSRELVNRKYHPAKAGVELQVGLNGPDYQDVIKSLVLTTDEYGSVSGSFELNAEAALGEYSLSVQTPLDEDSYAADVFTFRVEEYKKPEFEVQVLPAKDTARLGETVKAKIKADYYFGAPVSGGHVRYHILRKPYRARFALPSEWDWLYGKGFGASPSPSGLGDSPPDWNEFWDSPWGSGFGFAPPGELVTEGRTRLNENGEADIEIDTSGMAQDRDQELSIHVEVLDQSGRTIEGSGTVLVTKQQIYAGMELDRGWYSPGSQAEVQIRTTTVNQVPVDAEGQLKLYRVTASKSNRDAPEIQELLKTWTVKTGPEGRVSQKLLLSEEGQYRLVFGTQDALEQAITSTSTIWVHGPKFDGENLRLHDLEIIPDRRTYKPGDTARLLIHTAEAPSHVLLYESTGEHRFLEIPNHVWVLEIPITEKHVPNHFVELTTLSQGQVHSRTCQIYVPPVRDVLNLRLQADRKTYKPGEKGRIRIELTDSTGQPVSGEMTLTAYDKALAYIQGETGTGPKSLLANLKIHYWANGVDSTLGSRQFGTSGSFVCPEFHHDNGSKPEAGIIAGQMPQGGDPADGAFGATLALDVGAAGMGGFGGGLPSAPLIQPKIRAAFADTAVWLPRVVLDQNGTAEAEMVFPEDLTTWRIRGYALTKNTQVGDAITEVTTSKNLLVRLQSPRFLVEGDEVVLSANVHNYLATSKIVTAELIVPAALFHAPFDADKPAVPDQEGQLHLTGQALVKAGAEQRFDWRLKVKAAGMATVTVKALTDTESDAMRVAFPVRSRGIAESKSWSGFLKAVERDSKTLTIDLPEGIDPSQTELTLTLAPSPAGAMLEAIPFLAGYPYGCVEQTMSRFYPTVLAADTLKKLHIDLEILEAKLKEKEQRATGKNRFERSPVFDSGEMQRMSESGLRRLYRFQHEDGGWGWWEHDSSSPYMTAYVLLGLDTAAGAEVKVDESVYSNGVSYLLESIHLSGGTQISSGTRQERALAIYVLSLDRSWSDNNCRRELPRLIDSLYQDRDKLNNYGRALLALALQNRKRTDEAQEVLKEILMALKVDEEEQTASMPAPASGWWHWQNSDIETNAWVLRAILAIDPRTRRRRKSPTAWPAGVKTANTGEAPGTRHWPSTPWPSSCS